MEKNDLPKGWALADLENVITRISNGTTEKQTKTPTKFPVSRIETISNEFIDFNKVRYLKSPSKDLIEKYRLLDGDILFSNINSDSHLGKSAIYQNLDDILLHGINLLLIRPNQDIVIPIFLNYLFKHYRNLGSFISVAQHAVNQSSINQTKLKKFKIPILPLNEQKRIVSKIEELFSLIENVEKNVPRIIKQISKLMQKVIDDFTSQNGENDWKSYKLGTIADIKGGVTLGRKLNGKTINLPYLRVANVQDGFLDLRKIKEIEILENEKHKWLLKSGDILLTEGGDRDKLGRGTVWKDQIPNCIHQNHIFRVRLDQQEFDPDFISLILRSSKSKQHFQNIGKQSVNLASINKTQLSSVKCSIPELEIQTAQKETIQRTLDNLSILHELCFKLNRQITLVKKKILSYAFEGKLVSQDPNDEPASELLKRTKLQSNKITMSYESNNFFYY